MSFRVAQVSGVPIRIHLSWVVTFLLLSYTVGLGFIAQADSALSKPAAILVGAVAVLLLFACLLLHECGHCLCARRYGIGACCVSLSLMGGESKLTCDARGFREETSIALAGPAVSAILAGLFILAFRVLEPESPASIVAFYLAFANAVLAVANLVPAYPLDGGRVLHAALWGLFGDAHRSSRAAAVVGEGLGLAAAGYGAFVLLTSGISGIWPIVLGWYVFDAASRTSATEKTFARARKVEALGHGSAG